MEERQSTDLDNINIDDWNVQDAISVPLKPIIHWRLPDASEMSDNVAEMAKEVEPKALTQLTDAQSLNSCRGYRRSLPKSHLFCSCRLILSVISCLGFVNLYILRFNLNVAMTWMVNKEVVAELERAKSGILPNATSFDHDATCLPPVNRTSVKKRKWKYNNPDESDAEFFWSHEVTDTILSSFFWGYSLTQIPGGWLAERYGGKWFFGLSIFASSLFNIVIPWAAWTDYRLLIAVRFFLGIFQGASWPSMFVIWSRWATPSEKQKLSSLTYSGVSLGLAITFPVVAMLCDEDEDVLGWPYVFYFSAILGILWTLAWIYLVFDSPETHPRISKKEKKYICHFLQSTVPMSLKNHPATPWKQILTSVPFWTVVVANLFDDFTFQILIDSISPFISSIYGSRKDRTAWINAIPYVAYVLITMLAAYLYDIATFKHHYSSTVARKVGNTIGTVIPGILIFAASFMGCDNIIASEVLIISSISMGGFQYGSGYLTNITDLAPQHVGVLFGIANMVSTIFRSTAPFLMKFIVTNEYSISQWHSVFIMMAAVFFLGGFIYVVFGSAELQKWAGTPVDHCSVYTHEESRISIAATSYPLTAC